MKERVNKNILVFIAVFAGISIFVIYSAMAYTSKSLGNLALKQAVWYLIGALATFVIVKLKNNFLYRYAWFLYGIGIFLLILLLIVGTPINNSKCWLIIPGIGSIQPSEFMKLFIMLALANLISSFKDKNPDPSLASEFVFIIKSLLLVLVPSILTFLQPDTGAVIIYLVIYVFMMFLSGIRIRWFFIAFGLLVLGVTTVAVIYFTNEEMFVRIFGTSIYYRIERLFMWKDGTGLQLENAIAAIGSAGFWGHGYNKTPVYFPEAATDFIFAVFASNFGFFGVIVFIIILVLFDCYIISLMRRKTSDINKYVVAGILGMLLFQQIQNIGMTIGLLPITGITLPFISYGGSSLISYMIIVGILINIASLKERSLRY